jgi:hypothetical protein
MREEKLYNVWDSDGRWLGVTEYPGDYPEVDYITKLIAPEDYPKPPTPELTDAEKLEQLIAAVKLEKEYDVDANRTYEEFKEKRNRLHELAERFSK